MKPIYLFDLLPAPERLRLLRLLLVEIDFSTWTLSRSKELQILNRAVQVAEYFGVSIEWSSIDPPYYDATRRKIRLARIEDAQDLTKVFCHEISHALQYRLYGRVEERRFNRSLASQIRFEQEADRLSYYVYRCYFDDLVRLKSSCFRTYRDKDREWLRRWRKSRNR